jgi:hypothetical protein
LRNVVSDPASSDVKRELQHELKNWLKRTDWQGQGLV